uniref:Adenosine 3'-phospho 5'-phosphosulfate transporter 1 n=1 Tax=Echinostoma caproni TaxID=27848 RepID=A0A183AKU4_9TREM
LFPLYNFYIRDIFKILFYIVCDYPRLFARFQVMAGVNLWSVLLTVVPMIYQNVLHSSVLFGLAHPEFIADVAASATCSAVGQLFIFLTISQFGPATFVLIMTLRMGLSLLLSCILFGHSLSASGILGVSLVFVALFARMYWRRSGVKQGPNTTASK